MSLDLTRTGLPYFRTRYAPYPFADGSLHHQIRGRFELRMVNPANPSESTFSQPVEFLFDTGAELTAVSEEFADAHGFGDFRAVGRSTEAYGYDDSAPPRPAWIVSRWVRFRDYEPQPDASGNEGGGIHGYEFRLDVTVVEGAEVRVPILGVVDPHALFQLTSQGDEYWFILRADAGGALPQPDRIRRLT